MAAFRTSIALATYQGARYLGQQLESYLAQTRLPDELVISDEHSTDETAHIVQEFSRKAPFPVTFFRNTGKRGIRWNFENAVRHCNHEIILFSDQDDVWLPQHVERLAAMLEADERILAVSSNSEIVDENLNKMGYSFSQRERYPKRLQEAIMRFPKNQLELIARQRILAGHGLAFRKSLLPLLVPFSANCLHDCWVYILAASIGKVAYISEPLTLYRTHAGQTMGGKRESVQNVAERLRKASKAVDESPAWQDILDRFRQFPQLAEDFDYSQRLLREKLEFVRWRTRNRLGNLPQRTLGASLELVRRKYHRLGRGFITFGRDIYGSG